MVDPTTKKPLTPMRETFALELAAGKTQAEAYRIAFPKSQKWKPTTVHRKASLLAANGDVRARLSELQGRAIAANEVTIERIVGKLRDIAFADARELSELRRRCCRYCWGKDHRYQRTAAEMERDRNAYDADMRSGKVVTDFDERGGIGYNGKKEPNPECPECFGDGAAQPFFNDTRRLSVPGASLFAGVKATRDGLELKTHSQTDALAALARMCIKVPDLPPINGPEDCVKAQATILAAVAAGTLMPSSAQLLTSLIEGQRRAFETTEIARRLDAIEEMMKERASVQNP